MRTTAAEPALRPQSAAPGAVDVRLLGITKRFDDVVAVDDVTLEVEHGSFFALLGPSGCGKTTTLRMIGGFEEPTVGTIQLAERDVTGLPPYKRNVNTVFQSYALFPHPSIFENVAFGLRRRGIRGGTLSGRVAEILRIVGLEGYGRRKPRQLSGGQQQRVALARALVNLPQVLLQAARCGDGPSGRNGGFLHGYWSSLARLRSSVGDEGALAVARAAAGAIPAVEALDDDVWLRRAGMLQVSTAPAQDAALDAALDAARRLGVEDEAVPLSAAEVAERCRPPRFRRGVFFREGASVQPARLVRALRRAALEAGIVVHERSPATAVRPGSVETRAGRLRAPKIVVAANAWMTGWRPAWGRLTNFGSYVVLTEPVPELLERIGWTGGEPIFDGRMFLHYFRTTEDGRVLMGSGSGPIGFGGKVDARFTADRPTAGRAEAGLRRLLPDLADARIEHAWGGPIDVSADHLPFFGTVGGAIHYGAGYSGNGVGPSWLGGQILASLALDADDRWTRLPLVDRRIRPLPPEPLRRVGGGLVRAAVLACEEAEEQGRRPALAARAGRSVPRLLGLRIGTG